MNAPSLRRRLSSALGGSPWGPGTSWFLSLIRRLFHFCKLIAWQFRTDGCSRRAAGLTFETALSLVPLTAVGIAVLEAAGQHKGEDALVTFISQNFIPLEGASIVKYVRDFARNIRVGALGLTGGAVVLVLCFWLFHSVEISFNEIWRTRRKRPLMRKFTVFWTLATLAPLFVALSLLSGGQVARKVSLIRILLPFVSSWLILTMANRLLPHTNVSWRSSVVAGLLTALLFELAKNLFSFYFAQLAFTNYSLIYGRLALIPLLLLWIYYSWIVVFVGVETAYTLQHRSLVEIRYRGHLVEPSPEGWHKWVNGTIAARLVLAVAVWYTSGRKAVTQRQLARAFSLPEEPVAEIFRRLKDASLMMEVWGDVEGYLPAVPLERIRVVDVMELFRSTDIEIEEQLGLDEFLIKADEAHRSVLMNLSFAELAAAELDGRKGSVETKGGSSPSNGDEKEEAGQADASAESREKGGPS